VSTPYDAEKLGARCSECVLRDVREGGPVRPEFHEGAKASIIGEVPGEKECNLDRPLVGPAGMELTETLKVVGVDRRDVDLHYAIACQPPENDLDKVMLKWQRGNKKREKNGDEPLPSPVECCRPRLLAELRTTNLVTLGKVAYQSVTRAAKPIFDIRGGPVDGHLNAVDDFVIGPMVNPESCVPVKVLPTLHPSFVMRARRWSRAFRTDLSRAFRWFDGQLLWTDPKMTFNPSADELADFFYRNRDKPIIYDVETTFDDPLIAKLKCVGFSTEAEAMCVHLLSIEGPNGALVSTPYYTTAGEADVRAVMREFFINDTFLKSGHNAGAFDAAVIKQHFGVTPSPLLDTILLHRVVESELPHKLGYVGSIYTDVTSWKDAHTAKEASTDHELGLYCMIDCTVTALALTKLSAAAKMRGQDEVAAKDHRVQQVCLGLHEVGMLVDRKRRNEEAVRLVALMEEWRKKTREASGHPDMNLNSTPQIRDLLFEEWKLQPSDYTKLGDPSTSDEALRLLRTQNIDNVQVTTFIDALRRFRKYGKEYGTYVRRLVPYNAPLDGNRFFDEDEEEAAERGLILPDGRMHPNYLAHGTTSGRLSSSGPNAQNFPKHLRGMVMAQPGHVIIGADADQLELRIIASVANMTGYLDVFAKGGDPHALTASLMFGKNFDTAESGGDQWTKLRNLAKGIKYASFYGSGDETVHGIVTSAEDKDGNLLYPNLTVREVATIRRNWLKGIPQLPRWWEDTLDEYRNTGYVLDPVWLRRRDFLDGEAFNEIVNFPIQSAGAHIIHESTFDLLKEIPFQKWGPGTGLICQVHDALYVEAPCPHPQHEVEKLPNGKPNEKLREFGWCPPGCKCEANWAARTLEKVMNRAVPGLDGVVFKSKAKMGLRWSDV
jgi:DNA polymerase I-like protein with 3'-5' exonuclease and polymerase domains/uracil-DNA glycosylase